MPDPVFAYLHASRESMADLGRRLGLTGESLSRFSYACCEVKVELFVDMSTGLAVITKVDDRNVEEV